MSHFTLTAALALALVAPVFAQTPCNGDGSCPPPEECQEPGTCDSGSQLCSYPTKPDGAACNTVASTCTAGRCVTPFQVLFVRLHGKHDDKHLGGLTVKGRFVTQPPDLLRVTHGVRVHVQDALGFAIDISWAPEVCRVREPGIGALCVTRPNRKAQIYHLVGKEWYGVKLRLLALDTLPPYQPPVTVTISQDDGVDRVGSISDPNCIFFADGFRMQCSVHP